MKGKKDDKGEEKDIRIQKVLGVNGAMASH